MLLKNRKTILGIIGSAILLIGIGYTNCGGNKMFEDSTSNTSESFNTLEGPLPAGLYTVEFKDGSVAEFKNPEPVKYTVTFKDGSEVELLGRPME